jgi:hypothetical protein
MKLETDHLHSRNKPEAQEQRVGTQARVEDIAYFDGQSTGACSV